MSGECDKCSEHCLDCVCHDESLTTIDEIPQWLVASIIKRNLEETQLTQAWKTLESCGMQEEFKKFLKEFKPTSVLQAMREFAKLHPDKFYAQEETKSYGKVIVF